MCRTTWPRLCPGLPYWNALNDCTEMFAAPETHARGPAPRLSRRMGRRGCGHRGAWKLIEAYSITNLEQAQMMSETDDKGRNLIEVVNEWLDNNPGKVKEWTDQATT